jgi:hypothetical protein
MSTRHHQYAASVRGAPPHVTPGPARCRAAYSDVNETEKRPVPGRSARGHRPDLRNTEALIPPAEFAHPTPCGFSFAPILSMISAARRRSVGLPVESASSATARTGSIGAAGRSAAHLSTVRELAP